MTKQQLVQSLRAGMFADRDSIDEAVIYAMDLLGKDLKVMTAIYVLLNTVANEIEKIGEEENEFLDVSKKYEEEEELASIQEYNEQQNLKEPQ